MSQTVIQYVLGRLKELGVTETFGIPGDYVYPVCDAICDDPDLQWIGCANEVNASYAADGYARVKGVGVIVSTYGAGESYIMGGLAGAHAENLKVVSLTGAPGLSERKGGHRQHHMISEQPPHWDLFSDMVRPLTAGGDGVAVITPQNCVFETERLIAALLYHSKPVNFVFPRDVPHQPVVAPEDKPDIPLAHPQSDPDGLEAVVNDISGRITRARSCCILPGYLLRRYGCVSEAQTLIEASGLPFFAGLQDKGVLPESHPQFGGLYLGHWAGIADPGVTEFIEGCDCIVGLGPENHDFNNGFHTMQYELKATINIMPHKTRVGMATYENVEMKDVLTALAGKISKRDDVPLLSYKEFAGAPTGENSDPITYEPLYERLQAFLRPNDIWCGDTALAALLAVPRVKLPDGVDIESQMSWGAIGWGTGAMLGLCAAAPERRCIVIAGEGGHQMTACELGTFYRYGLKPVFLVANNQGYLGERATNRYPDEEYNDLAKWNFADLPAAMGCEDWYTAKVETLGELDAALTKAQNAVSGVYIEIMIEPYELARGGDMLFTATGALFGMPDRTWSRWLKEMESKRK